MGTGEAFSIDSAYSVAAGRARGRAAVPGGRHFAGAAFEERKFGIVAFSLQCVSVSIYIFYYAALLPRRGPHIASHSVCPSVCLSVRPVLVYIRTVLRAHIQNS